MVEISYATNIRHICIPDLAWGDFNELIFCHIPCGTAKTQQAVAEATVSMCNA